MWQRPAPPRSSRPLLPSKAAQSAGRDGPASGLSSGRGHRVSHSIWVIPLVALALTQAAAIATSVYLHRGLAHRALRLHPIAAACFRVVLWLTTGQSRREWVAVHRKHHTFTDRAGDPHSPRLLGLWRVQILNVYYYMREARNPETIRTFAPDVVEDWWDRTVFARGLSGLGLGIGLLCLTLGVWQGLSAGALHAILYVFAVAPLINGLGHWRGAQTSRTPPTIGGCWPG